MKSLNISSRSWCPNVVVATSNNKCRIWSDFEILWRWREDKIGIQNLIKLTFSAASVTFARLKQSFAKFFDDLQFSLVSDDPSRRLQLISSW